MNRLALALLLTSAATAGADTADDVRRFEDAQREIRAVHQQAEAEDARARAAERAATLAAEPGRLRRLAADDLCADLGDAAREDPELLRLAVAEARRRGLAVSTQAAQRQQVRIGDSACQVLASWGRPWNSRRVELAGRVSVTHSFGTRTAVEVTNGRVSAILD